MITQVQALILAAGKSTRLNTGKSKLLEPICGQPMIMYPIRLLEALQIPITMVVGYQKEEVMLAVQDAAAFPVQFVTQEEQRGTGHAIMCTRDVWQKSTILIINGDTPLITQQIIKDLVHKHVQTDAAITFITAHYADVARSGYGRVCVSEQGGIEIVEARNFTGDSEAPCCINAGIYLVKKTFLDAYIDTLIPNGLTKEIYFTDLVKIASDNGYGVSTLSVPFDSIRGINTFQELWATEQIQRADLMKQWMDRGVRFSMPQQVHIDLGVHIGAGTVIKGGVHLTGNTIIGSNCTIAEFNSLHNVSVGDNTTIHSHCIIADSQIQDNVHVGPFAHVRTNSLIQNNSVIGNFVEVKNSTIGAHTKAKHLSYVGDAHIGSKVNIGAGTITCNYDGAQKHATIIEDNVFIGSNNTLVAPLTIHKNSFTAAGSTITKNVPEYSLAFGRARQVTKEGYMRSQGDTQRMVTDALSEGNDGQNSSGQSFIGATKTHIDTSTVYLD